MERKVVSAPRIYPTFPPTVWGVSFASLPSQDLEIESYTKERDLLKEKVKLMLMKSTKDITHNIEFIYLLCRLCLSYHFETEIEHQLQHIFVSLPIILQDNDCDLYTSALLFQVLRRHGYKMTCDVFNKFKDMNGEFKKSMRSDAKGLLSFHLLKCAWRNYFRRSACVYKETLARIHYCGHSTILLKELKFCNLYPSMKEMRRGMKLSLSLQRWSSIHYNYSTDKK